jgi:glycosyltransferase involved in cell wall biosynthesis
MYSFIIPAHNEEAFLAATLRTLVSSADILGEPYEVIVVDDASTDGTADIARQLGARVVAVNNRQIAATRNAGARAARGEVLVFVDADTLVPPEALVSVRTALANRRVVGGGSRIRLDGKVPLWGSLLVAALGWAMARFRLAAGCFVFARRAAFEAVGGFDEAYFASEEYHLSRALRRKGWFVIVPEAVTTSARKFDRFSAWDFTVVALRILQGGKTALGRREGLGLWYGEGVSARPGG